AGGYRSQYHTWQDFAARNKMADAVRFMVRDTIIKRGAFDQPFIMNNPIMQTWFLFTGWGFAAFNRYTIPLLQRFEANQILGTVLIAGAAAMEGVSRKLARGEEVDMDDEHFFLEAFSNSGVTSMIYKSAMMANALLDNEAMKNLTNDKYKNISVLGSFGGPGLGLLKDYAGVMSMVATGKFNQTDIKKGFRSIPLLQPFYLQGLT